MGSVVGGVVVGISSATRAQTEGWSEVVGVASGWMRRTARALGVKTAEERGDGVCMSYTSPFT